MMGQELTIVIENLVALQSELHDPDQVQDLEMTITRLRRLRDSVYGKLLVDPAKLAVELERREAGVR